MARLRPLRGIRFDPAVVDIGGVLAPPYDVISPEQREALYARNLRNVVRIDYGAELPGDRPGEDDRYTRAGGHLHSWLKLGILLRERTPAFYVSDHEFLGGDGRRHTRRGIYGCVGALPWDQGEVLPHERTMRGPKEDRLALMRATRTQTSAIWTLWDRAPGIEDVLALAATAAPVADGETEGELDVERHRMWAVTDPRQVAAITGALAPATFYIADGHHRYETAVAYAQERRAAEPEAPENAAFETVLLYLTAADDPSLEVWGIHRLVRPQPDVPDTLAELRGRLAPEFTLEPQPDLGAATEEARRRRAAAHAYGVAARDGAALLTAPRAEVASPRAGLDVTVLAERVLGPALGITPERITEGALEFTRRAAEAEGAVRSGDAAMAFTCTSTTTGEIIAVSLARETMPQKSTYFYPKVPTGLVLSPLDG